MKYLFILLSFIFSSFAFSQEISIEELKKLNVNLLKTFESDLSTIDDALDIINKFTTTYDDNASLDAINSIKDALITLKEANKTLLREEKTIFSKLLLNSFIFENSEGKLTPGNTDFGVDNISKFYLLFYTLKYLDIPESVQKLLVQLVEVSIVLLENNRLKDEERLDIYYRLAEIKILKSEFNTSKITKYSEEIDKRAEILKFFKSKNSDWGYLLKSNGALIELLGNTDNGDLLYLMEKLAKDHSFSEIHKIVPTLMSLKNKHLNNEYLPILAVLADRNIEVPYLLRRIIDDNLTYTYAERASTTVPNWIFSETFLNFLDLEISKPDSFNYSSYYKNILYFIALTLNKLNTTTCIGNYDYKSHYKIDLLYDIISKPRPEFNNKNLIEQTITVVKESNNNNIFYGYLLKDLNTIADSFDIYFKTYQYSYYSDVYMLAKTNLNKDISTLKIPENFSEFKDLEVQKNLISNKIKTDDMKNNFFKIMAGKAETKIRPFRSK